jgi:uncharacterized lipoprotein YddW (UPF0748 family)
MPRKIGVYYFTLFLLLTLFRYNYAQEYYPALRGIWLSREVLTQGRTSIQQAFEKLKAAGINTIFINNWYLGSTIYPSQVLADYGAKPQLDAFTGWDPLAAAIEIGHRLDLKIHVWFEYGLVAQAGGVGTDTGPLLESHLDWMMLDREGHDYAYIDLWQLYQYWMDPVHPEVIEFIKRLFVECVIKYPEVDGIQVDRFRYPSKDFSFSEIARQSYQSETGDSDPLTIEETAPEWQQFLEWREDKVTALMDSIYRAVKAANPYVLVSGAVVPPYMFEGSEDKLQNWDDWFANGSIDLLCPMLYGLDVQLQYWIDRCHELVPSSLHLAPGISLENMSSGTLSNVLDILHTQHLAGNIIWYYGYLNNTLADYLETHEYAESVPNIEDETIIDDRMSTYLIADGLQLQTGGFDGTYLLGLNDAAMLQGRIPVYVKGSYRVATFIPEEYSDSTGMNYRIMTEYDSVSVDLSVTSSNSARGWYEVAEIQVSSGQLQFQVIPLEDQKLVFDAVRLQRIPRLQIVECFAADSARLKIRLNRPLEEGILPSPLQFWITPETAVTDVQVKVLDRSVFMLTTTPLIPEQEYLLRLWEMNPEYPETLQTNFMYVPDRSALIDNSDDLFIVQSGNWESVTEGSPVIGEDYLRIPCGDGSGRVYWRYPVSEDGYYALVAFFPDSSLFASDAQFIIKNDLRYDTIRVNQQKPTSDGYYLGTVWADAGKNLVIKLHNASENGPGNWVVADAIRIERDFFSVAIQPDRDTIEPHEFALYPNYPNPFNLSTNLRFALPFAGQVEIELYNLRGRLVRQYQKQFNAPGVYDLRLDCCEIPSGVYIYSVSLQGLHQTGKMLLLK